MRKLKLKIPLIVFLTTALLLSVVQMKPGNPMILAERFMTGGGWIEIFFLSVYTAIVSHMMLDYNKVPKWRTISWTVFSVVFFGQLLLGLSGFEKFLMTGKLHLPIPMMIAAGPVYRLEISFMPILFISTILVSGPVWCSQLCYFGAFDNLASKGKTSRQIIKNKGLIKTTILITVIITAMLLRLFSVPLLTSTILAGTFGMIGALIIIFISSRKKKMVHCILWCPVGTLVNVFRHVNPFRMYIDKSCTLCMHCTSYCKYDALNRADIEKGKPGITCTLCGDCLAGCSHNSIKYSFLKLSPDSARTLWIIITVSLHGVFLALGRI